MSAALKNDPGINGIKINDSEYLLSQYADDSSLLLDDDETSLVNSLNILEKFSECAGLRANLDKTEAIWIGSKVHSNDKLALQRNLNWNYTGKFKLLGIKFDLFNEDKTITNFEEKIEKIQALLNSWIYRELTYMGKIIVIKSLALPILIQSLTVLPNPPSSMLKQIQNIFFNFLWSGKPDKIKRNVLIGGYENGGLKMPHIESFCFSLKMTWINKLLDPLNISPWKTLLIDQYNKYGADKIWLMTPEGINKVSSKFNSFWKDIFLNWNILNNTPDITPEGIMKQSIWLNNNLKISNKTIFYQKWCDAGIYFICDLLDENSEFLTLENFCTRYNLDVNFLEYHSVIHMIPNTWKELIANSEKITQVTNENYEYVKKNKKSCQYFCQKFVNRHAVRPSKQEEKWDRDLNTNIENWEMLYTMPFKCTKNNKLLMFQFKILHRTLATNAVLHRYGLKETHMCDFCNETKETICHLFWECMFVRNLWIEISEFVLQRCNFTILLDKKDLILGETTNESLYLFTVLVKYYIYTCRFNASVPCLAGALKTLKNSYKIEKLSTSSYGTLRAREKFERKWNPFRNILDQ